MEEVGEYGTAAEESLLARKDPFGEVALPSIASGRCHNTVVAVDDAEWACVVDCVCLSAIVGAGSTLFGKAHQYTVVVVVTEAGIKLVVGIVEVL